MGEITFSPMAIDAIGEAMNISLGSSATAVSNMLDHRVDITTPTVQVINAENFTLGRIEPAIGVEIKYVSGLEGSNIMMLKRSDVKAIVDILLGTETPDEEFQLDELSVSVVCEVMNQMMGAASTALSDLLGRMVNISTPDAFELTDLDKVRDEHFPVKTGPIVVVSFQLSIEGVVESEFMNVMSVELAKELVAGMGVDMSMDMGLDVEEPEPEPAPAASSNSTLSQDEIEKLVSGSAAAAPEPAPAASSGGKLSQEEIEKLLASGIAAEEPKPAPAQQAAPAPQAAPEAQAPMPDAQMPPPGAYPPPGYPPYPQMPAGQGGYPYPPYPPYYMYPPQPQQPAQPPEPKVINTQKPRMEPLSPDGRLSQEQKENLDLIMGVSLEVAVEIGRTRRKIQDIIAFSKGSLVVLDKLAGEPVDLLVNGQCIARGDVVVIDDNFGIRITEILQKPDINELTKF